MTTHLLSNIRSPLSSAVYDPFSMNSPFSENLNASYHGYTCETHNQV